MGDKSKIEWTEATWNVLTGCSRVSEGCRNCYAERLAATRLAHLPAYEGTARMTPDGPRWTGVVRFNAERLDLPLRWRRPRMIFVNSQSDLFHEAVTNEQIAAIFGVMAACPQHVLQVLTKRPERAREWFRWIMTQESGDLPSLECIHAAEDWLGDIVASVPHWPLPNVWLGVSVEDQATANARIPLLLDTPAAVRWISAEPLLGPVDLRRWVAGGRAMHMSANVEGTLRNRSFRGLLADDGRELSEAEAEAQLRELQRCGVRLIAASGCENFDPETGCRGHAYPRLDWCVAGGESGPGARPAHPDWFRSLRDQCMAAGMAFFFKQWGDWCNPGLLETYGLRGEEGWYEFEDGQRVYRLGKKAAGRLLDGRTWDEMPTAKAMAL